MVRSDVTPRQRRQIPILELRCLPPLSSQCIRTALATGICEVSTARSGNSADAQVWFGQPGVIARQLREMDIRPGLVHLGLIRATDHVTVDATMSRLVAVIIDWIGGVVQWLTALDRPFAFLLALPFIVALVGLATELIRQRRAKLRRVRQNGEMG
jgi:hypothetical protein